MHQYRNSISLLAIICVCTPTLLVSVHVPDQEALATELHATFGAQTTPDQYQQTWFTFIEYYKLDRAQQQSLVISALKQATESQKQLAYEIAQLEIVYGGNPADKLVYAYTALAGAGYLSIGLAVYIAQLVHTINGVGYTVEEDARPDLLRLFAFPIQSLCQYILVKTTATPHDTIQWIGHMSTIAQVVPSLGLIPYASYWAATTIQASQRYTLLKAKLAQVQLLIQFLTTLFLS